MISECEKVWGQCLNLIKDEIPSQSYKTWFMPIVPKKILNNTLTIQVPNKLFYEWLEDNYLQVMKKAIKSVISTDCKLEYAIPSIKTQPIVKNIDLNSVKPLIKKNKESKFDCAFNNKYLFDTFIEGKCNRVVKSAAESIAENPGNTAFNPFIVYGSVGIGKTHIAQAIGNYITKHLKNKKVNYISSEAFAKQYVSSIKENNIHEFAEKFMDADVLILDDIQFLAGRDKTQETFFHIFNHLHQSGKQLVMTSDTPPHEIAGLQERLLSRFKWGLTAQIQPPSFETRYSIVSKKLDSENVVVDPKIIEYIASFPKTNIRELEGIVNSILIHASINKEEVTFGLAKKIVSSIINTAHVSTHKSTIGDILNAVASYYNIDTNQIKGQGRSRSVVIARKMAMYMAKNHTSNTLKIIGDFIGKRHHSTVLYSVNDIESKILADIDIKKAYEHILGKINV